MQKLGTMIGASLMLVCANLPGASWMTDFSAAQAKAKAENKLLLLDFTGSDWCGWCMKLKAEVFTQPEFEAFASQNLILVEVDFPHRKALSPAQQKANKALAEKYNVQGFPSIMLLDSAGLVLGQMGYRPGGAKPFVARLQQYAGPKLQNAKVEPPKPEEAVPPPPPAPLFNGAPTAPPPNYADLQLKGISGPQGRRLAIINNQTLAQGEAGMVKFGSSHVKVQCLEIRPQSVVIVIGENPERQELFLQGRL